MQSDRSCLLIFSRKGFVQRSQIHEGYARASFLALRKNPRRNNGLLVSHNYFHAAATIRDVDSDFVIMSD